MFIFRKFNVWLILMTSASLFDSFAHKLLSLDTAASNSALHMDDFLKWFFPSWVFTKLNAECVIFAVYEE
jgi:hypothetical protein